jgi:hypothetical protein
VLDVVLFQASPKKGFKGLDAPLAQPEQDISLADDYQVPKVYN